MKKTNQCPKCQSYEIYKLRGVDNYKQGVTDINNRIAIGFWGEAMITRYICMDCGFSEEWLDSKDLENLKEKLEK